MKISIKLLKGDLFQIEAETTDTVDNLKSKIQAARSDLPVDRQKLIHAGKVLKDTQTVAEVGVSESDFLVCMVTKEVAKPKSASPAPSAAPVSAPAPAAAAAAAPVAAAAPAHVATAPIAAAPAPVPHSFVTPEALSALTGMGFPESESRAALQAAMGNPDLAYEFLLTGIPEQALRRSQQMTAPVAHAPAAAPVTGIQQLRSHPQFNMLKQLIQSNPASLPQVLSLIGQQSPALLEAINANEQEFLTMMNEPISNEPAPAAPVPAAAAAGAMPPAAPGVPGGMDNPANLIRLLSMLPPEQRNQMAAQMGLSPEQLNMFMQIVATMPPEQLNQMLQGSGLGGMGGAHPGAHGGPPPGAIMLTQEEMDSVNRLMALGFSQQQAAQAFIACDRNETLAANFLFENGWNDEGDFGDDHHDEHDHDDHDHGDDMYH